MCRDGLRCAYNSELKYHPDRLVGENHWCLHTYDRGCTIDADTGLETAFGSNCFKLGKHNLASLMTAHPACRARGGECRCT